jgi:HNH endonuclease
MQERRDIEVVALTPAEKLARDGARRRAAAEKIAKDAERCRAAYESKHAAEKRALQEYAKAITRVEKLQSIMELSPTKTSWEEIDGAWQQVSAAKRLLNKATARTLAAFETAFGPDAKRRLEADLDLEARLFEARQDAETDATDEAASEPSKRRRETIPERVRHEVWRRDEGQCIDCGSRERLEYDHIIALANGGANTPRNIELRCEACNRRKYLAVARLRDLVRLALSSGPGDPDGLLIQARDKGRHAGRPADFEERSPQLGPGRHDPTGQSEDAARCRCSRRRRGATSGPGRRRHGQMTH